MLSELHHETVQRYVLSLLTALVLSATGLSERVLCCAAGIPGGGCCCEGHDGAAVPRVPGTQGGAEAHS